MYAIVEIAGLQYKVEKDQQLYVNRLPGDSGDKVVFDRVLLTDNGNVHVGAPVIDGASVSAKIIEQVKGDKVIVFKKKRRKGYKVKNGHRQWFSRIEIVSIEAGSGKSVKKETKAAAPKAEVKKEAPKAEAKKEVKSEEKTEAPKAEVKKAPAAKKDDLTIVEGIGPKSAEALVAAGIDTFEKLSKLEAEEIRKILTDASDTLAHLVPDTWAKQAEMAAEGKMDELKAWQDELMGGREN